MSSVMRERSFKHIAIEIIQHKPVVIIELDIGGQTTIFIRTGQSGIISSHPAQSIIDSTLPVMAESFLQGKIHSVIVSFGLGAWPVFISEFSSLTYRAGIAIAWIGNIEYFLQSCCTRVWICHPLQSPNIFDGPD